MARAMVALALVAGCGQQAPPRPLGRPVPSSMPATTLPDTPTSTTTLAPPGPHPPSTTAPPDRRTSLASWYGSESGGRTASGAPFDGSSLSAAHRSLPFDTRLSVCHGARCVEVVVNDRGPYIGGRDLDLSRAAFLALAPLSAGVIVVDWSVL